MTARAIFPPGEARDDWSIVKAVSDAIGKSLPFETLQELRGKMYASAPQLAQLDMLEKADASSIDTMAEHTAKPSSEPFGISIDDYYLTNPIARASAIMASLSAMGSDAERATGTDG